MIESAALTFPAVETGTRFLVQWLDDQNKVLGRSEVMDYPTNLLQALKPLAGGRPVGLLDPERQLGPLLKSLGLELEDLADVGMERFSGRLAFVGPFPSPGQVPGNLVERVAAFAKSGVAMVWIQAPSGKEPALEPAAYPVRVGSGTVVIVQSKSVANPTQSPLAQLNLVRMAELALNPDQLSLPFFKPQSHD